jgi:hypothetical protein
MKYIRSDFKAAFIVPMDNKNSKLQITNNKWFDKPFDRLTVLSEVEGLTTLSKVEG